MNTVGMSSLHKEKQERKPSQADIIMTDVREPQTIHFHPVNADWQERICQGFSLACVDNHDRMPPKTSIYLSKPKKSIKLKGDGNCV